MRIMKRENVSVKKWENILGDQWWWETVEGINVTTQRECVKPGNLCNKYRATTSWSNRQKKARETHSISAFATTREAWEDKESEFE